MSFVKMYTARGEEHGLVNILTNSVPFDDFKHMDEKTKAKCIKDKKEDCRIVKMRYINTKGRTERLPKKYCRWSGEPLQEWVFIPNHVYEVPMGLVNEVNAIKTPRRSGLVSLDGRPMKADESPLDQDQEDMPEHMMVPSSF